MRLARVLTYTVYYDCAEDGCRDSLAVFGVLRGAHHDMVAAGEHAADGAKDYDGEDGDDDAGCCQYMLPSVSFSCIVLAWWAYHVQALKAETTGFMIAARAALSVVRERFARVSLVAVERC